MNITILTVGKIKEKYFKEAIAEYLKRLKPYAKVKEVEVADQKAPEKLSLAEKEQLIDKEGEALLKKIDKEFVIITDIAGQNFSSEQFAAKLSELANQRVVDIIFVIGGSLGLSSAVKKRANLAISFGKMTYPHKLMKVILAEQIYRTFCINNGRPYHK